MSGEGLPTSPPLPEPKQPPFSSLIHSPPKGTVGNTLVYKHPVCEHSTAQHSPNASSTFYPRSRSRTVEVVRARFKLKNLQPVRARSLLSYRSFLYFQQKRHVYSVRERIAVPLGPWQTYPRLTHADTRDSQPGSLGLSAACFDGAKPKTGIAPSGHNEQ